MSTAAGCGTVSTSVTVFSYANSASKHPITARYESGGTTAPVIQEDPNVFEFSWSALTAFGASAPPPFPNPSQPPTS